jgi:NAD(P)-dependent dehydrogenase (short-subunit alcohol dehydrogenase family)
VFLGANGTSRTTPDRDHGNMTRVATAASTRAQRVTARVAYGASDVERGAESMDVLVSGDEVGAILPPARGLVVLTTFTRGRRYLGNVFYDVAKNAVCRLASGQAEDLGDRDITVIALSPGWMAVERMPEDEVSRAQMESPEYIGRAVAALASGPRCYSQLWPRSSRR